MPWNVALRRLSRLVHDPILEHAEPADLHPHDVARLQPFARAPRRPHARRRPREDHVARLEGESLRDVLDQRAHAEDHRTRARVLLEDAIHPGLQAEARGVGDLVARHEPRPRRPVRGTGASSERPGSAVRKTRPLASPEASGVRRSRMWASAARAASIAGSPAWRKANISGGTRKSASARARRSLRSARWRAQARFRSTTSASPTSAPRRVVPRKV